MMTAPTVRETAVSFIRDNEVWPKLLPDWRRIAERQKARDFRPSAGLPENTLRGYGEGDLL